MQNSIWKLTALAGVIGIGFLIALQTQNSLHEGQPTAQNETPSESDSSATQGGLSNNATGLWQSQSEPDIHTEPRGRGTQSGVRLTSNEEPNSARHADPGFEPFDKNPRRSESVAPGEFVPESRSRALPDFSSNSREPFDQNAEPDGEDSPRESSRSKALRLLTEAREAIDANQLQSARVLAMEALDLPVVYGPLEERPASVLEEIEALIKAKSRKPIAKELTDDSSQPAGLLVREPLENPFADSKSPPSLKSDLSDEPFANTEPAKDVGSTTKSPFEDLANTKEETLPLPDLDDAPKVERQPSTNTESEVPRLSLEDDSSAKSIKPLRNEPQTQLIIRKDAPTVAKLGFAMIYSMTVENRGDVNAAEVSVEDSVPQGCELVGTNPQAELNGKKLVWKLGRIEAGQSKVIRVKVIPREEGDIGTVARVISVAETDAIPRADLRPATPGLLRLSVTGPERVIVGESATLKFKLTNAGDQPLSNINLQNIIPAGFRHSDGNDLSYPIKQLDARQSLEVDLDLKAVRAGEHIHRSIVTVSGRVQTETNTQVEVVDTRSLRVETSDMASMPVGQPAIQETRLINESTTAATGVVVVETLPADLRFIKASHGGQYDAVNRKVRWNLDLIPAGETALLKLTVQPKTTGPHSCVIEVNQSGKQRTESVESRVKARGISGLKLDIDHAESSVLTGEDFTIEVRLKNRGSGADSNVALSLLLPAELEFVQARGPVRNQPPEVGRGNAKLINFLAMPELGERAEAAFEITLRGKTAGKAKMRVEVVSHEVPEAIASESLIVVLDGNP